MLVRRPALARMFQRNISWVEKLVSGSIVPEERFVYKFLDIGKLHRVARRALHRGHGEDTELHGGRGNIKRTDNN